MMQKEDEVHMEELGQLVQDDLQLHGDFYEILKKCSNSMVKKLNHFIERDKAVVYDLIKSLDEEKDKINIVKEVLKNKANSHERLMTMSKDIEKKESDLKKELELLESEIKLITDQKKKLSEDKELDGLKKMCKMAKILTGTVFDYQGSNISGIMSASNTVKEFDFSTSKFDVQSISQELWKNLGEISDIQDAKD